MTAYSVTRPEDLDREHGVVVEIPSVLELRAENERLRVLLAETVEAREAWHSAWVTAVERRIVDRQRLSTSMRVLSSLGRLSPRMADVVEVARRRIWGELP